MAAQPTSPISKRMSARDIWDRLPERVRVLGRDELRNYLCWTLGYSYFVPQVNKLADRLVAIRDVA